METPLDVLRTTVDWIAAGRSFAAVVVLGARGSTPRKGGARALVDASGEIAGTVGGGVVENEARRRAVASCRSGRPEVVEVSLHGTEVEGEEPVCGGVVRLLVDSTVVGRERVYRDAIRDLESGGRGVLLTRVSGGTDLSIEQLWLAEGADLDGFDASTSEGIRRCLASGSPVSRSAGESGELYLEPILPDPRLLIVGGGHIGQALARLAAGLGFEVTVVDDRPEYADPTLYPDRVVVRCGDVAREVRGFGIDSRTYVVIVTRGHRHDADALAASIRSSAAYVGMIGSRRKVRAMRDDFLARGLATDEEFGRVHAPVGLDIGADTPAEIAISIAAQLVAVRRRGPGVSRGGEGRR